MYGYTGKILLVEDRDRSAERIMETLKDEHHIQRETDPSRALLQLPDGDFDLMIVSLSLEHADGLRLCSQVRSLDRTRRLPIMIVTEPGDDARLLRGLDMGVNDYIVRPVDSNELLARVRTQALYRLFAHAAGRDRRDGDPRSADRAAQPALHDEPPEDAVRGVVAARQAAFGASARHRLFQGGQRQLRARRGRFRAAGICRPRAAQYSRHRSRHRLGGEEFVVVMPDTDLAKAYLVGERLRQCIAAAPFYAGERIGTLDVTASVGVAALEFPDDTPELILKRADQALYCAKRDGRNRVVADAA